MIQKNIDEQINEIAFVKRAAKCFSKDEKLTTYTDGEILPGCLFAVKWGFNDDCVLVFKISEESPTIWAQCIKNIKGGNNEDL